MEHREGATLADDLARAPFPVQELLRRATDLANALNQLHRKGRVHGSLQPAAILTTTGGLELAERAGGPGALTPYTAPEQLHDITDARSDIFSFGAIVYEMATGRRAFVGTTPSQLETAILETQPPSITTFQHDAQAAAFYSALDHVLMDCLIKNSDQRRQRMQTVLVDLKLMASAARAATAKAPAAPFHPAPPPAAEPLKTQPQPLPPAVPKPAQHSLDPAVAQSPVDLDAAPVAGPMDLPLTPASPADQAPPSPAAYKPPAPKITDSMRLPSPALEEEAAAAAETKQPETAGERTIEEHRASDLPSQVGPGEAAPFVVDPREEPLPEQAPVARVRIPATIEVHERSRNWMFIALFVLLGLGVLALVGWAANAFLRKPSSSLGVLRFALPAPEQASYLSSPAISPNGKLLAFSAVGPDKKRQLWIRPLNSLKAAPLDNTTDALAPFWSPDSRNVGFFAGKKLKKVPAEGGPVVALCDTDGLAGGGAWSRNDVIVFGRSFYDSLYRVPAAGGTAERVTKLDSNRGERAHLWPLFLPDGNHFLFYALSEQEDNNGVSIGSLDSKTTRHLLSADTNAIYAELGGESKKGYLLYAHGHRLTAQSFDPVKLALQSEQFTVADGISYLEFINLLPISAANNGLLAYQTIDAPKRQLVWLDRDGNQVGALGEPGEYGQARISPDGRHVAVNRLAPGRDTADIWFFDIDSGRPYQFTSEPTHEGAPVWSPDGDSLVYFANPSGHFDLFRKTMGTSSKQEALTVSGADKYPNDWSSDGKYLIYGSIGSSTNSDLWVLPMKTRGDPFVYLQTVNSEGYAQFSPNGKWVAYQSDESGKAEVYVESFPRIEGSTKRWQISTEGGGLPKWRGDGKELYYIMGNGKMMAVTLNAGAAASEEEPAHGRKHKAAPANNGEGLAPSAPRMLFQTRALPRTWNMFDATPDGHRFLVNTPLEWASSSPITVVANWTEGFKK